MKISKYNEVLNDPERWLSEQQHRWLRPRGLLRRIVYAVLYAINRAVVRAFFRLEIRGLEHLPSSRPFILVPSHSSPFDPPILAATFPLAMLQDTYWAGKQTTVLRTPLRRLLSWLTRVIPIGTDASAVAAGVAILEQGRNLVWFPEGRRSLDGQLQEFKPGIAFLLSHCDVPFIPVFIEGAYEAFPSGAKVPRFRSKVMVHIGRPRTRDQLGLKISTAADVHRSVECIRESMLQLRDHESCVPDVCDTDV